MRLWLFKARISAALDGGKPLPAWMRRWAGRPEKLRRVEGEMTALDRDLRESVPQIEAPESLHRAIMQAVQAPDTAVSVAVRPGLLRWLPAPVLLILVLGLLWPKLHQSPVRPAAETQSLAAATAALEVGDRITQTTPANVAAPLSDELERLNRDLHNTAQFLLASVP